MDGGKTTQSLNFPSGCFYVAIDRMGWFYTGGESGAYRSMDGFASTKTSWESYSITMYVRHNHEGRASSGGCAPCRTGGCSIGADVRSILMVLNGISKGTRVQTLRTTGCQKITNVLWLISATALRSLPTKACSLNRGVKTRTLRWSTRAATCPTTLPSPLPSRKVMKVKITWS